MNNLWKYQLTYKVDFPKKHRKTTSILKSFLLYMIISRWLFCSSILYDPFQLVQVPEKLEASPNPAVQKQKPYEAV